MRHLLMVGVDHGRIGRGGTERVSGAVEPSGFIEDFTTRLGYQISVDECGAHLRRTKKLWRRVGGCTKAVLIRTAPIGDP